MSQKRSRRERRTARGDAPIPQAPRTRAVVEAAIEKLLPKLLDDPPAQILEENEIGRTVTIGPNMVKLMKLQKELFTIVFGREPGPEDPIFWDTSREAEGPMPLDVEKGQAQMRKDALTAGIRPEMAYAMGKTGLILTKENQHLISEEDKQEWSDAVEEYQKLQ